MQVNKPMAHLENIVKEDFPLPLLNIFIDVQFIFTRP